MEPSKRSETTPEEHSDTSPGGLLQNFADLIEELLVMFVGMFIFILIMSGILALTQFHFNPFAFIQSYYPWMIGFVVIFCFWEQAEADNSVAIFFAGPILLLFTLAVMLALFIFIVLLMALVVIGRLGFPL